MKPQSAPSSWGPIQPGLDFESARPAQLQARARRAFELAKRAYARDKEALGDRLWRVALVAQSESSRPTGT